jgi:hypothetical protein
LCTYYGIKKAILLRREFSSLTQRVEPVGHIGDDLTVLITAAIKIGDDFCGLQQQLFTSFAKLTFPICNQLLQSCAVK